MVPNEYLVYFSTMATVGAALFGLIFVAISIAPQSQAHTDLPELREIKAVTAYIALINPLVISLFALVPHHSIATVVIVMSISGLFNTAIMTMILMQIPIARGDKFFNSSFILIGFLLYGYEAQYAIRLLQSPTDEAAVRAISNLLIGIAVFGVIRSWELVGIRQFHFRHWLSSSLLSKEKGNPPTADPPPEEPRQ